MRNNISDDNNTLPNKQIEDVIKSLDVAFIVVDKNMRIMYANIYARKKLFHNNVESFYGKDVKTFHSKRARKSIAHLYRKARKGRFDELPFIKLVYDSGKTTMYFVKMGALLDSKGIFSGFVLAFFDVTSFTIDQKNQLIEKIPVRKDSSVVLLDVKDIVYMHAEENKTLILDSHGNEYFSNLSLKELENKLNIKGFFRTHRCCIVSLSYIREVIKNEQGYYFIKLSIETSPAIPLSRRQYCKLKKLFPFGFR